MLLWPLQPVRKFISVVCDQFPANMLLLRSKKIYLGKTPTCLKTICIHSIVEFFSIICGISLGYKQSLYFLEVGSLMELLKSSPCVMETWIRCFIFKICSRQTLCYCFPWKGAGIMLQLLTILLMLNNYVIIVCSKLGIRSF